jgi:hypothetical protein
MAKTNQETTTQMTARQAVKAGEEFDRILVTQWRAGRVARKLRKARLQYWEHMAESDGLAR